MEFACSFDAFDISCINEVILLAPVTTEDNDSAVSSAILVPFNTAEIELSISSVVSLAA